ncbi:MAG: hypothetical protein AAB315_01805, partial [Pseudomonadota bacterium]
MLLLLSGHAIAADDVRAWLKKMHEAAQRLEISLTLACPVGYDTDPVILGTARAEGADVTLV